MRKRKHDDLEIPNSSVDKYYGVFQGSERYYTAEVVLFDLFKQKPSNATLEEVLHKVTLLDAFYSTNLYDTIGMAKHIISLNIDVALQNGDCDIVNKIAKLRSKSKVRNCFSFATKYCSFHKPEDYPIFDSFVEQLLLAYKDKDHFAKFRKEEMRDFVKFREIYDSFIDFYKLNGKSYKEIDKFLWLYGKKLFKHY